MVSFDADYEEEILARCLVDRDYTRGAARMLDRRHFSTAQNEWVWKTIRASWIENTEVPSAKIFKSRAAWDFGHDPEQRELVLKLVLSLFKREPIVSSAALRELRLYTEYVALTGAIETAAKRLEVHDTEGAVAPLREVLAEDFRPRSYELVDWIEQFEQRQAERKKRREEPEKYICIPTGIPQLDRVIDGNRVGEFGLVMGTTGRGKSIFLTHLGFHAIARGYRVLHLTLEMKAELVAARYDSRWSGVLHKSFKTGEFTAEDEEIIAKKYALAKMRFRKKLRIISTPVGACDINVVRGALHDARDEMGGVDMVILDSADHLKSLERHREARHAIAEVFWSVKRFADEEAVAVWSSTHAKAEAADRIATAESAAESYDKSRIVDTMLSLNAIAAPKKKEAARAALVESDEGDTIETPPAEEERARTGLDLFLAKYRDGESRIKIPLATDLTRMLIREAEREEREAA